MAAFRFEDDFAPEAPVGFLDFQGLKIKTREDLEGARKKIPDLKLRKEKVEDEEYRIIKSSTLPEYPFEDPVPEGVRNVKIREVSQVEIDWKMLTLDRPKTKTEEDLFTRFVEIDKQKIKTLAAENPRSLYGGRILVSLLPTAPKKTRRRKKKIAKPNRAPTPSENGDAEGKDGSNSDDDDDEFFDAVDNDDEQPQQQQIVVRFSYEYYIRRFEDNNENDAADFGDLAEGKEQADPPTPEKTSSGKKKVKTKKKKPDDEKPVENSSEKAVPKLEVMPPVKAEDSILSKTKDKADSKNKTNSKTSEHKVTFEQTKTQNKSNKNTSKTNGKVSKSKPKKETPKNQTKTSVKSQKIKKTVKTN